MCHAALSVGASDPPRVTRPGPPVWKAPDRVEAFDLDLDVAIGQDEQVSVLDQDEFEEHRDRYGYPDELVVGAEAATSYVLEAIDHGDGPFGGAADAWFRLL